VHAFTAALADAVVAGTAHALVCDEFFDTIAIKLNGTTADDVIAEALAHGMNLRKVDEETVYSARGWTEGDRRWHSRDVIWDLRCCRG
jgi:glycine cleavage system pyridoxal-binding protein P